MTTKPIWIVYEYEGIEGIYETEEDAQAVAKPGWGRTIHEYEIHLDSKATVGVANPVCAFCDEGALSCKCDNKEA